MMDFNTTPEMLTAMLEATAAVQHPQPTVIARGQIMQGIVVQYDFIDGLGNYVVLMDEEDMQMKLMDIDDRLQNKIDWLGKGGPDEGDRISILRDWEGGYEVVPLPENWPH